jgi:hypothetical protein
MTGKLVLNGGTRIPSLLNYLGKRQWSIRLRLCLRPTISSTNDAEVKFW